MRLTVSFVTELSSVLVVRSLLAVLNSESFSAYWSGVEYRPTRAC